MPKLFALVSEYSGFTLEERVIHFCYLLSSVSNNSKAPKDRFKSLINCQTRSSATKVNGGPMQGPNAVVLLIFVMPLNRVTWLQQTHVLGFLDTKVIYEEYKKCKNATLPCVCNRPALLDIYLSFCMQSKSCILCSSLKGRMEPRWLNAKQCGSHLSR